jgi:hypothetical protein
MPPFGISRSLKWWLFTSVSVEHIGPIFEGQAVQQETTMLSFVKSPKFADLKETLNINKF